jgi:hypothetical protein
MYTIETGPIAALAVAALLVWLTLASAASWDDVTAGPQTGAAIDVQRAEVVHISILARWRDVIAFLVDVHNWTTWAPWIRSVSRSSSGDWTLDTDAGPMKVHFAEPNTLGVLDHEVTLASGVRVLNSMRVLANGSGSELVMVLFQSPETSTEQFEQDLQAVRDDLARIKTVAEALARRPVDERAAESTR